MTRPPRRPAPLGALPRGDRGNPPRRLVLLAPALLLLAAGSFLHCRARSTSAPVAHGAAGWPAEAVGCSRLLRGPLGEGVPWAVDSGWHREALGSAAPEAGLSSVMRSGLGEGSGDPARGWLVHDAFAALVDPAAPPAPVPTVERGRLELLGRASVAARIVRAAPFTPYVLALRVRQPAAAASESRMLLLDLSREPAAPVDPIAFAERILSGEDVTWLRSVGPETEPPRDRLPRRLVRPLVGARDGDGFEAWRVEFTTESRARALLLIAFGSDAGPVALDDVVLHELPARALLGRPDGALTTRCFDLPRPRENLDPATRVTKVRCDWESRRALLLPRGSAARCRFGRPVGGGALELGLAIVREERLTRDGPRRERLLVRVGAEAREVELELEADAPRGWRDLAFALAPPAGGATEVELEIRVLGEDSPDGPLLALSDPLVFARPPALPPAPGAPPNLVMISLDTLRADRLGRTAAGRSLTPHLDRLAAESLVCAAALANASYTLPSHVSMLTSQRPGEHGVITVVDRYSQERSANLAQIAARHGYATAAFTSGIMLNADFCGIDVGFDRFGEIDPLLDPADAARRNMPLQDRPAYNGEIAAGGRLERSVIPWLAGHRGVPFVLLVHTYLVHNYRPEPRLRAEFTRGLPATPFRLTGPIPYRRFLRAAWLREQGHANHLFSFEGEGANEFTPERDLPWVEALYDATVAQADRDVGGLLAALEELGLARNTLVVVTSDHGEEFLEHGDLSHARTLFDEILRVPLLVRGPGLAPRTIDDPVELIDLAPTLLARMGLPRDPRMRGADLLAPDWEPRDVTIHEGIELQNARDESGRPMTLRAVRARSGKLILLTALERRHGPGFVKDDEVVRQLHELGYLGGGTTAGGFYDLELDPAERTDLATGGAMTPVQASRMAELARRLLEAPLLGAESER